jgi:hypothetical protein
VGSIKIKTKIMKKDITYIWIMALAIACASCDENEIMPAFSKKGTATATIASIASSNTTPLPSETITLTMRYVSPSSDPLTQITLKAKVGAAEYVEIQTFNVSSVEKDAEVIQTVNYISPASAGTVIFDMVISSQKPYPQVKRTSVVVQ